MGTSPKTEKIDFPKGHMSDEKKSTALIHIDAGDWAKPANMLIEKIADAIGGLAKPWQIKRVAEAESEAERIHTVAAIEITRLQKRAMTRLIAEEARKQNNIESITAKALPQLESGAKPENVEDDWIANFFDKSRLISDEGMQELWAKVLAGEANQAGRFSKRTINHLASLDKADAALFEKLCSFNFLLNVPSPLIYDTQAKIHTDHGINFGTLSHLESIGFIQFNNLTYINIGPFPQKGYSSYFDEMVYLEFPDSNNCRLNVGKVRLTQIGEQLAPLCEAQPVEGFADYVREKWRAWGYKTEPSQPEAGPPSGAAAPE